MLFNSYEFIFAFLPVTLAGFFLLGSRERRWALAWLVLASLVFYAWWRPLNVLIIAPSLLFDFAVARGLARLRADRSKTGRVRWLLTAGIVFNVCFLGYFKYVNFFVGAVNDLADTHFVFNNVILPLGISFITFQKIAFLVDVHAGHIKSFTFAEYCLFVLFFPQLIAGPIVHYREMMPQFQAASCRPDGSNLAVGVTLFVLGLFKKVVLADGMAQYVSPVFGAAAAGDSISLLPAWMAAVGFTLQIYFDFSGYSDMALGLARLVGVRLPVNFDSPLKARSIIDFWLYWHATLTRFLTAYVYNPLVLRATRARLARGMPILGGHSHSAGAFLQLLAVPTLITMLLSGFWHGAGYLFLLWGLLHGVYLVINHAWRLVGPRLLGSRERYERIMRPSGFAITFFCVVVAMVVFRATSVGAARNIFAGMFGFHTLALPAHIAERLEHLLPALQSFVAVSSGQLGRTIEPACAWTAALLFIALVLPNSLQLTSRFEPALAYETHGRRGSFLLFDQLWRPSFAWAFVLSALAAAVMMRLSGESEFLYWQF